MTGRISSTKGRIAAVSKLTDLTIEFLLNVINWKIENLVRNGSSDKKEAEVSRLVLKTEAVLNVTRTRHNERSCNRL